MKPHVPKNIFARERPADLIGRSSHLERLIGHADAEYGRSGLMVLATPRAGTSELLRQAYDRLFTGGGDIIPFYFEFRYSDRTARDAARRFLCEFLVQAIAHRRRDAAVIYSSPGLVEIAELAPPSDGHWVDSIVETCRGEEREQGQCHVRSCLSAPLRAAGAGARAMVIIDDVHVAARLEGGHSLVDELMGVFSRSAVPFVFAGHRRFLFGRTPFDSMAVEPLSFTESGRFAEMLSERHGIAINEQTRDLIAVQFGGRPALVEHLFTAAAEAHAALDSFDRVQQIYTDEIFGGRTAKGYTAILDRLIPGPGHRSAVLRLLAENLAEGSVPAAYWQKHLGLADGELKSVLDALHNEEIVNVGSGRVTADKSDIVLSDHIRGRASIELNGARRALAIGEMLSVNISRAPRLMARFYRLGSALGLRRMLEAFDGRQASLSLLDYSRFKHELKGADRDKSLKAVREDNDKITLPNVIFTADTAAFYPALNELCDAERSAVALGFAETPEKDEVVWIAAEIESKLEAAPDVASFWCDRLEMVAADCGFENFRIWLVAPEGFDDEAMSILHQRNAYGSSRSQAALLAEVLHADVNIARSEPADEYEIVVPMGHDTEMIAAHTVEEIAKRHGFPAKAINQIKTALVEACINASEHSLSPDRRIHQRFSVSPGRITITVSNRGVRLADKAEVEPAGDEGRRGWGLKLIKGLMDEVEIERTDDGTRLTMVKYIKTE